MAPHILYYFVFMKSAVQALMIIKSKRVKNVEDALCLVVCDMQPVMHMFVPGGQKRALEPLELALHMAVSHLAWVLGNRTLVL